MRPSKEEMDITTVKLGKIVVGDLSMSKMIPNNEQSIHNLL